MARSRLGWALPVVVAAACSAVPGGDTPQDVRARALLDAAAPPTQAGRWPVRLPSSARKLLTPERVAGVTLWVPRVSVDLVRPDFAAALPDDPSAPLGLSEVTGVAAGALQSWVGSFSSGFLDALLGIDYDARYTYVARAEAWVILQRDRPACLIASEVDAPVVVPGQETPPAALEAARLELERDVASLVEAGESSQ